MKRIIYPVLALSLAILACSIPTPATPTQPPGATEPPVVTEPPAEIPAATEPPAPITNVICGELSLYLDPALASSFDCEIVPESSLEFDVYPAHTVLTLQGYPLTGKFFLPHISVYSVQRYTELLPDHIPGRVTALQNLIGGALPDDAALPFLPVFNAGQVFHAQYLALPFFSGGGIRFLAEYAQYFAPVNNAGLFYTYQGLTNDGLYWVSAILPVNHPMLPDNGLNPPGGQSWEEFSNNYEAYIGDMVSQLNAQPLDSFVPSLAALDALVSSITIQP